MATFTKKAVDVFAPTEAGGAPRKVVNGEVQTWGAEVEEKLVDNPVSTDGEEWQEIEYSTGKLLNSTQVDLPILVLATGQSNMLGVGTTGGDRSTKNKSVYVWEQIPGTGQTTGWKNAGPNSPDWPFITTGNNHAYHFCDMLQRKTGRTVLLVMHAAGGQPIAEWLPSGGGVPGATGHMYSTLNAALVAARAEPIPGRLDGATLTSLGVERADILLWHQGEADADYRGTTGAQWKARFRSVVSTLRDPSSGGSGADPFIKDSAPVLVGELFRGGTSGGNPTDDRNVQIWELDKEEALVAAVSSEGLKADDDLHFNGSERPEFARRHIERLGVFPKLVPVEVSSTRLDVAGRLVLLTGSVTVNASTVATVNLPVTMANSSYVPKVSLATSGASSTYVAKIESRTPASFNINNPTATNMMLLWEVLGLRT